MLLEGNETGTLTGGWEMGPFGPVVDKDDNAPPEKPQHRYMQPVSRHQRQQEKPTSLSDQKGKGSRKEEELETHRDNSGDAEGHNTHQQCSTSSNGLSNILERGNGRSRPILIGNGDCNISQTADTDLQRPVSTFRGTPQETNTYSTSRPLCRTPLNEPLQLSLPRLEPDLDLPSIPSFSHRLCDLIQEEVKQYISSRETVATPQVRDRQFNEALQHLVEAEIEKKCYLISRHKLRLQKVLEEAKTDEGRQIQAIRQSQLEERLNEEKIERERVIQAHRPQPTRFKRPTRLMLEKLAFLAKGHKSGASSPASQKSKFYRPNFSPATNKSDGSASPSSMSSSENPGAGVLPQIDAPASAINGGERRVSVRCASSTVTMTVTPETSPIDLIYATTELVPQHNINPSTSIIVECYEVFGLERRLRKYERIRDAMNSWDFDEQNPLLIMAHDSNRNDGDLELSSVPRTAEAPSGFSLEMRYSSRPQKWKKCWIHLMDNGQMFASKRSDSKYNDKDSTTLCHLSDFDIYTPKGRGISRHFKAPKKFSYAIKSQQKINAFPTGKNFVHFFCTDDFKTAQKFHELVHGWRSWYLANKQIDLLRKDEASMPSRESDEVLSERLSENLVPFISEKLPAAMKLRVSEKLPEAMKVANPMSIPTYNIGGFEPLVVFEKPLEEFGKDPAEVTRKNTVSRPRAATSSGAQAPTLISRISSKGDDEFLAGGLLGDSYEKRKQSDNNTSSKPADGPFTEGSLLNSSAPVEKQEPRSSWFPSAMEHSARERSQSMSRAPRRPMTADASRKAPLLNFSQQFPAGHPTGRNNPRPGTSHGGGGHGFRPPPGPGPLIDQVPDNRGPFRGPAHQRSNSSFSTNGIPFGRPRSRSMATGDSWHQHGDQGRHPLPKDVPRPPFAPRPDDRLPMPNMPDRSSRRPEMHMRTGSDPRMGHARTGSDFRGPPDPRRAAHMRTASYADYPMPREEMRGRGLRLRPSEEQLRQEQHQLRSRASQEPLIARAR